MLFFQQVIQNIFRHALRLKKFDSEHLYINHLTATINIFLY